MMAQAHPYACAARVGASKRAPRRSIPLRGPILPLLRRLSVGHPPHGWVFARHDGVKPILFDVAFDVACKRAGIIDFHVHDLRYSCASYLAMNGATAREVQEVLGHKNITQSGRYMHLSEAHTAGVLEKMADRFLATLLGVSTLSTLASAWLIG